MSKRDRFFKKNTENDEEEKQIFIKEREDQLGKKRVEEGKDEADQTNIYLRLTDLECPELIPGTKTLESVPMGTTHSSMNRDTMIPGTTNPDTMNPESAIP